MHFTIGHSGSSIRCARGAFVSEGVFAAFELRNYHGAIKTRLLRTILVFTAFVFFLGACTSDEEFCQLSEQMDEANDSLDEDDPEAIAAAADQMELLAETAPPAIRADMLVLVEVFNEIAEVSVTDMGADTSGSEEAMESFSEVMTLMMSPEVIAAGESIEAYLTDVCGMERNAADE